MNKYVIIDIITERGKDLENFWRTFDEEQLSILYEDRALHGYISAKPVMYYVK